MNIVKRLRTYDKLTLAYLSLVMIFLAISPQRPAAAMRISLVHAAMIALIVLVIAFADRFPVLRLVRDFYPIALFTILFEEFTHIATVLFPYWLEPLLINFDLWVFGVPSRQWTATNLSPSLIEFLAFAYWSYYLIIPGTLLFVYRRNAPREMSAATTRMCLTMYICYMLFMLSPARGPHHALPVNGAISIEGGFFTNLVHAIQKVGSVQGAAFPSSHVAVAWAMFFILRRNYPHLAWLVGGLVSALTVSVITVGYHFSLDALGGVAVAFGINVLWPDGEAGDLRSPLKKPASRAKVGFH